MRELPGLLRQAAHERSVRFRQREQDFGEEIRDFYRPLVSDYRERLDGYFRSKFPETWEPLRARELGAFQYLSQSFDDLVDAAAEDVEDLFDEELTDGYDDGYLGALWLLRIGGLDVSGADVDEHDDETLKALLLAAGIAGIAYPQRLQAWHTDVKSRFSQMLRAAMAGGMSGSDTLGLYDAVTTTYVGRVEGLGRNELHRAYTVGAATATEPYRSQLAGEVWLTRRDPDVCPTCRALELTITDAQPIRDTHPGCRCWKVPIPLRFDGQPLDYVAFLQQIGRR